jgi:hypothetical protein
MISLDQLSPRTTADATATGLENTTISLDLIGSPPATQVSSQTSGPGGGDPVELPKVPALAVDPRPCPPRTS